MSCHAGAMDEDRLRIIAACAMEEAGLAGLCREGRVELARDRLAAVLPAHERHRIAALIASLENDDQAAPP
jgi:hypothetical protein